MQMPATTPTKIWLRNSSVVHLHLENNVLDSATMKDFARGTEPCGVQRNPPRGHFDAAKRRQAWSVS